MREQSKRRVLQRIEDLANNQAKDYNNVHLIPRGTPVFPDKSLRGIIRFATRQGNFLPVIQPNNQIELIEPVVPPTTKIKVNRIIQDLTVPGALLSIGPGRELAKIYDVDETTGEIVTESTLIGSHDTETPVDQYGSPVTVIGSWTTGDTVIQIRSPYPVMIGDQIAIDTTPGLINSTVSTLLTAVQFLGLSGSLRNYQVTLDQGISRDLQNEESIYLRGQPGYQSNNLRVSTVSGPFVLDHISGPFFEDTVIDEYLNIQLFDSLGSALPGYGDPVSCGKNFSVPAVKISNESMLFWDVIFGSIQFRNGKFVARTDQNGRFCLSKELVPIFPPGTEWDIPVLADSSAQLRIQFEPNEVRNFSLSSGIIQHVTVGMTSLESPASRIEIVVRSSQPGAEVEFSSWSPLVAVSYLSYQVTSTAFGSNVWQSGSLMLKPYFWTLQDIRGQYDVDAYDSGVVAI